jgi:poly-gamma-glutamate synthesis protein (capsule biosynthesis protein)
VAALLKDPPNALAELRPFLAGADLAVVNLETAITSRGTEQPKKYHFRAPATALVALQAAGVDAVTMANNHAVDYGPVGLEDTLAAQDASPVPVVGIGRNAAEAYAPATFDVRGTTIALLGATQVPDWTRATWPAKADRAGIALSSPADQLLSAVQAADATSDVVVVYLHWGTDYTDCPDAGQKRTMTALRQAGADVIVGGHAHRIQGSGWAGDTFVAYGLGNFVWYGWQEPAARTGVLTVTLDERNRPVMQAWAPLRVSPDGVPRTPNAAYRQRVSDTWLAARRCSGLASAPVS